MKKNIITTILISFALSPCFAQDVITIKSGDDIQAKVSEITPMEVKYKKFDNLNGPIYSIPKTEVFMIKYENGTKDVFNLSNKPVESKEKVINTTPSNLMDVLKSGNISEIIIVAGDSTISVTISKTDKAKLMNCIIPVGSTKFGIIENGQIYSGGIKYLKTFSSTERSFSICSSVEVNNFNSDGFSLELDESVPINIPIDEISLTVTLKGKLNINVPSGYSMFMLSGLSGTINSGKIVIKKYSKDDKQKHLFAIEYGNMTIK